MGDVNGSATDGASPGSRRTRRPLDAEPTRRRYLAGIAAAGSVAVAGCGGDGSGEGDDGSGEEAAADAGSGDCGPDSISYHRLQFSTTDDHAPIVSVRLPGPTQTYARSSAADGGTLVEFEWRDRITILPRYDERSIEALDAADEFADLNEITDDFETYVEGSRVFASGDGSPIPATTTVYVPAESGGTLVVEIGRNGERCEELLRRAYAELIGSIRPVQSGIWEARPDADAIPCPDSFTYAPESFAASGSDGVVGACDFPESTEPLGSGLDPVTGLGGIVNFPDGSFRVVVVRADLVEDSQERTPTVKGVVSDLRQTESQYDWVDATGRFDLSPDGGTVIASSDAGFPAEVWRAFDHPMGVLAVNVSHSGEGCPEVSRQWFERVVRSLRPA